MTKNILWLTDEEQPQTDQASSDTYTTDLRCAWHQVQKFSFHRDHTGRALNTDHTSTNNPLLLTLWTLFLPASLFFFLPEAGEFSELIDTVELLQ